MAAKIDETQDDYLVNGLDVVTNTFQKENRLDIPDNFCVVTLSTGTRSGENYGANGLPVTPSSTTLIGNFRALVEPVVHQNLVQYVDCFRNKHEKVGLVSEFLSPPVTQLNSQEIPQLISDILQGLHELHYTEGISHGNITPSCFVSDGSHFRLNHWCLNILTENGRLLDSDALLPDDVRFTSPERIIHASRHPPMKSDIWSFGLSLLTLVFPEVKLPDNPADLARLDSSKGVLRRLDIHEKNDSRMTDHLRTFFHHSLEPNSNERASVRKLMKLLKIDLHQFPLTNTEYLIRSTKIPDTVEEVSTTNAISVKEAYYFLCLASPGFKDIPGKDRQTLPPIQTIPHILRVNPVIVSQPESMVSTPSPQHYSRFTFVPKEYKLTSTQVVKDRLKELDPKLFYPLILFPTPEEKERRRSKEPTQLPLIIRENDFAYQVERTILFKCMIEGVPYSRHHLMETAQIDINPFYRAETWASILNVKWSNLQEYETIDKITGTTTDRQISVDIPRCHQYNELLASPQGHLKLTRILKAWLKKSEPQEYVYWQGLDSLAAPFVIVNFGNEARAFACFDQFISKYLRGFFSRDNSPTIQEYLALFSHLIAFHDPDLFNHLDNLCFTPELYAIPWFLTMFTHVLPLHKTIHVWDTLLFGNETFPLCIGLAILFQLRGQLLDFSFNDCILIFSDLPEIYIDNLVRDAIYLFKATPKSALTRDWLPLEHLKSQICPEISMRDVVEATGRSRLVIIDMRSLEMQETFGSIPGAIVFEGDQTSELKQLLPPRNQYKAIVVVNNVLLADQLVREGIARVASLTYNTYIPKELSIKSTG
jgi:TBC domain-containing protein kinase-like protein